MIASDAEGQRKFEDYAYVLDYLPQGKPGITWVTYRAEPTVQLIGEDYFTLLETLAGIILFQCLFLFNRQNTENRHLIINTILAGHSSRSICSFEMCCRTYKCRKKKQMHINIWQPAASFFRHRMPLRKCEGWEVSGNACIRSGSPCR